MALENILDNASKYSREGESIVVSIAEADSFVIIRIKDNGVGLRKDDMERLFQKFVRLDNILSVAVGGNGLGLYWAKNIIELHQGTIEVASKVNHGSTFTVKLPVD
jgi:signal transduction histidine kinase